MGIIAWIVVGAIAGFIATLITGTREGIVMTDHPGHRRGARRRLPGGAFLNLKEPTGINVETIVVSVIGAIIVVFVANLLMAGRRARRSDPHRQDRLTTPSTAARRRTAT